VVENKLQSRKWSLHVLQMNALKNLGLNVVKASVCLDSSGKHNKFSITKAYAILPCIVHVRFMDQGYD